MSDTIGFDPRTWAVPSPEPGPVPESAAMATGRSRRWILSGGAGLFIATPIVAWLGRDRKVTAPSPSQPGRAASIRAVPDVVERSAQLDDVRRLEATLLAQGVGRDEAALLTRAALPHLAGGGAISETVSLRLVRDGSPEALRLQVSRADSSGVVLTRDDRARAGWASSPLARTLERRLVAARGEMNDDSLYSSAVTAGIDETLIPAFAQAFVFDFDFQREIHAGDVFEMAAEQTVNASGAAVGSPALLYASFTTAEKARALYRFAPQGGKPGWFDGAGRSTVRSFMRTPVDGARVSSRFGLRVHPVQGFVKMHKGVDFAVPMGTPVYAAGSGVVTAARFTESGGNMLILRHDKGYETRYLHLERFGQGIAEGTAVAQGQQVALSGNGGHLSTGPHLHYEVHLNGEPIDPLALHTEDGQALPGADLAAFRRERDRIDVARAAHAG